MSATSPLAPGLKILTVGHSARPLAELVVLLDAHAVARIADVRAAPYSRRHPQFNREPLARSLAEAEVGYVHLPGLGGRREAREDSINTGLGVPAFRGYADHMQSVEFERALDELVEGARLARTELMCAEAEPAHCHRSLLADALTAHGLTVEQILDAGAARAQALTAGARIEGSGCPIRSASSGSTWGFDS